MVELICLKLVWSCFTPKLVVVRSKTKRKSGSVIKQTGSSPRWKSRFSVGFFVFSSFEKFVVETATHVLPFNFLKLKLDRVFDLVLVVSVIKDQHTIFQNNLFCQNISSDIENQSSKSEKYFMSWWKAPLTRALPRHAVCQFGKHSLTQSITQIWNFLHSHR